MRRYRLHSRIADQLLALEAELRRLDLWEREPPPRRALASTMPFCCDTLTLPQWLQFVFVPRMVDLIEAGDRLPSECGIRAIAEETVARDHADVGHLLQLLGRIDALLTA